MELQQAKGSATRTRSSNKPPSKSRRWFSTPVRALRCYGCALAILGLLGFLTPTGAIWAFVCGCLLTCCDTEHTDASMRNQVHCARQCAIIGIIFSLLTIVGCVVTGMYLWLDNTTVCSSAGAACALLRRAARSVHCWHRIAQCAPLNAPSRLHRRVQSRPRTGHKNAR